MALKEIDWQLWCRLCAKENITGNINVLLKNEDLQCNNANNDPSLASAISKYFRVTIQHEDNLPKTICTECFSLITDLVNINERVTKVQEFFSILQSSCDMQNVDGQELKLKFGLMDENREFLHQQPKHTNQIHSEVHYFDEEPKTVAYAENEPDVEMEQENPLEQEQGTLQIKHEQIEEYDTEASESSTEQNAADLESMPHKAKKSVSIKKLCCTVCRKTFKRSSNLKVHMKRDHQQDELNRDFQCPHCSKLFKQRSHLNRHISTHLPIEERKMFSCPYEPCGKTFTTNWGLKLHMEYIHNTKGSFVCDKCGVVQNTLGALNSHMLIHVEELPFECEICKKCFKTEGRLRGHKDRHAPSKYVCPECGLELNSRETFNRHKLVHTDEMQHKCDYCGRAFKRAKALKNHLILHTGLKPYSCDFCDRTFANGSNCRTHKKKSHPEELAAQESSGGPKRNPLNIPKLQVLKAITKSNDNLAPVVSKQSGCFSFGKKPKRLQESNAIREIDEIN